MKKLIGIVLALCMLCTVASAATVNNAAATADDTDMTVSITYDALADAQATMLAYKVADGSTVENFPAFADTTTTPIVGIDQAVSDGTFDFKVAEDFEGTIAILIGGDGIDNPAKLIVTFEAASEGVQITLNYGDVNGDGKADEADASLIVQKGVGLITGFVDQQNNPLTTYTYMYVAPAGE